jgi:hypothetical protein
MDGGGVEAAAENPEKSQVFSGFGQGAAPEGRLGANEGERVNAEKPMVFSGSGLDGGLPGVKFPEKTGGLSGSARVTAGDWLMRNAPPPGACLRAA